jgi:integral membrane sensor domain MASE1
MPVSSIPIFAASHFRLGASRSTRGRLSRYGPFKGGLTSSDVTLPSARLAPRRGSLLSASSVRYAAGVVVIGAGSYAFAEGGKALYLTGPAGAFWPAGGLAIAVLYLGGLRWWPGILLGDLGSLLGDVLSTELQLPLGVALAEAAGDMARAVVAVAIFRRLVGARAAFDRLKHVGAVLVAIATGAAISATVAMLALKVAGDLGSSDVSVFWRSWWLGDLSGGLVVIPLVLAWARPLPPEWLGRGAWEGALMMGAVVGLSAIALSADQPLTYIVFPALMWGALRFGPQGGTLAVAVAVVMAVWATSNKLGPFLEQEPSNSALNLQLYITIAALTTLCLAAIARRSSWPSRGRASRQRARRSAGGWSTSCTTVRRTASSGCRSICASPRTRSSRERPRRPPRSRI